MYKGLFLLSSYILAIYSPKIPIENSCTPLKKVIATISDAQPDEVDPPINF